MKRFNEVKIEVLHRYESIMVMVFYKGLLAKSKLYHSLKVLAEIREWQCGNHSSGRSLAHKVRTQGIYWPMMRIEAQKYANSCKKCQRFSSFTHMPLKELTSILNAWLFM